MSSAELRLLKINIANALRARGVDPQSVDLDALIDPELSYEENLENIERKLGIRLRDIKVDVDALQQQQQIAEEQALAEATRDVDLSKIEEEERRHLQELDARFRELVERGDPVEALSRYLFPELMGEQYDLVRKAVLLSLATHFDRAKRTRIHVLIYGPPGCGKTEILKWLSAKLGAAFVNGEHVSKVGLVGDARGREIRPGVLAEYHGHVVCIDEIDKIPPRDQGGLLQAMEEGAYTIVKGRHRARLRAEIRVIASANSLDKVIAPLRDRFDFVIELRTPTREERAKMVDRLVDQFFGLEQHDERVLRDYLEWIADFEPKVEQSELDKIKKVLRAYIELTRSDIDGVSVRSLELSVLRIAYAIAKLYRSNVRAVHVVRALRLKDPSLTETQYRYLMAVAAGQA